MTDSLTLSASRLGLAYELLTPDQLDRLLVVELLRPETRREAKVQFVHVGDAEQLIEEFFMTPKAECLDKQMADERAVRVRRLILTLGFHGAAILPAHEASIEALAETLILGRDRMRPLNTVTAGELPRVRALLLQLPQTVEIRKFLKKTEDGLKKIVI